MPNWNMNNLKVKGEPKLVLQFIQENYLTQKVKKEKEEYVYILDFEKILPTPLKENGEIIDEWYTWRYQNWGTKWSASSWQVNYLDITGEGMDDVELDDQKDDSFNEETIVRLSKELPKEYTEALLQCSFDTAWCPPEGMFRLWKEKYKPLGLNLSISFYEPGCCFAGEMSFDEDNCTEECYGEDEMKYIAYLLEEGWECIDFYIDEVFYMLEYMNKDKGNEFVDKLQKLVAQKINEAPTNLERAMLICDIFDNFRNYEPEKKEE